MDTADFEYFVAQGLRQLGRKWRQDAGETAAFARQLEHIYAKTYDVKYPEMKSRELIPVDFSVDPGAELVTYRQFDEFATAKIGHDMANDGPSAEIKGVEFSSKVVSLVASYRYSLQDLRKASMAGINLDGMKAMAARRAILRKMESLAATGDTNSGLVGLADTANGMTAVTVTPKTTANTWTGANGGAGATPADIMADFNALQRKIFQDTKGIYTPDTVVLGTKGYSQICTTMQSPTFNGQTVMQFILNSTPWIKAIIHWPWLDTAGSGGTERILCYKRDPEVLQMIIPQDFEQLPPQARAYAFIVNCHARFGGLQVRYPKAVAYMDSTQV